MTEKIRHGKVKKKIAVAAVITGIILSFLTYFFVQGVKEELWEQSISAIKESTQQGCNTLRVQLQDEYEAMGTITKYLKQYSMAEKKDVQEALDNYARADKGISLYLSDGSCIPSGTEPDKEVRKLLLESDDKYGIIDPHISSSTGVNVFNLYVRVIFKDGTKGYLLKEYEVGNIVSSFSLSFYEDTGFSYVINQKGKVLIRSPHPNSNKTMKNLFDMLPETQNDWDSRVQFKKALKQSKTGWAVFRYRGKDTVLCYTPLNLQSDWYLISIIPKDVVDAQTNEILRRSLALIGCILAGISALVLFYFRYAGKTNRKLQNQADYIMNLYNAVPEGIALISVDLPYRFIQLNQQGLHLLGYPGSTSNDVVAGEDLQSMIHPDDYAELAGVFQQTVENGDKNTFEHRIRKEEGTYFWASGILERTLDDNGNPVLVAAFHDITDEKLAKEAAERAKLQERITLVGAISNAYPVIISMNLTKDTLSFVYVKKGLMLGLGSQTSYSRLYEDVASTLHPDNLEEFKRKFDPGKLYETLGKETNEVFLEARQKLSDGNYHWTSTQIIAVDNPYSDDKLAILISRRIDRQRYEEEQQRQALQSALDNANAANTAKSQFLSNMSHDIRTPMNAIVGMTAIATAHADERERVMECLEKITLSSKHLLSLINDVLDMSKIESGKFSLRDEPFNLAELMADVTALVKPQADAKQLHMKVQLTTLKNEKVIGDALRVRQVCINILSNAVKYTQEGGDIDVRVRQESSMRRGYQNYVFCCADNGVGMSKEFLDKLFLPFERAADASGSKAVGTGLGMAITRNVVDLMNGDIQVESEPLKGSVFTVTLPFRLQETQQKEIPGEWNGVRSLIVDDDLQTCRDGAELLNSMGLRADFAGDGENAVNFVVRSKAEQDPVQLVIVDWKMPGMDGLEVTRRIRAEVGKKVPLIILTAYDWAEIEEEARDVGVTTFLSKPLYYSKLCYLLGRLNEDSEYEEQQYSGEKPDYTGRRILLVEDNDLNREISRTLIEEMGVLIDEAVDGEDAVQKVSKSEENYYDMILMDIQMPKMNGYDATKAIRTMDRRDAGYIPIIAMTANAFEEDVRTALRAGMNEHFAKPIDVQALERLLHKYLVEDKTDKK